MRKDWGRCGIVERVVLEAGKEDTCINGHQPEPPIGAAARTEKGV